MLRIFFALCFVTTVFATGLYSVVGPGTLRSDSKYNVAVSVHKADGPCQIEVGITGPSFNGSQIVDVHPMSTKNVEFKLPKLQNGDYNLTATGLSGIVFKNSTKLNYADYKPLTYIQTDKATYKPGDLVQFRVLFLDSNTRPADIKKPITILITDSSQNRIKQLQNIELTKGVYTGSFQLSEQPNLGMWNIEVLVNEDSYKSKSFEVAKYVLPKFDVTIETAKDVAIPDGVIKVTVRSKYTYGKSVKGKAVVSIKPSYHYYGGNSVELEAEKTIEVDGKGHVEFDLTKDISLSNQYPPPLKILAIMEEELTGNKQNTTATVNLHRERYRIESIEAPSTYHPEKPLTYKVVVKHIDGSPVQDQKTPIKLILEPPRHYFYRSDLAETTLKPEEKPLEFESKLDEHGTATFEVVVPNNNNQYYSVRCSFADTTVYIKSLNKFTPTIDTPELLKINVNTESPQLNKDLSVEIKSSEFIPYFVYTIVARGNIVKSEHVDVPEQRKSHTIKIKPTFDMVPKATLYIHYIFNNELRFEEQSITFEKDFENSIDIHAAAEAKPGADTTLEVVTDPNSFVGLLGVDQSVLLLKSGNDLDKNDIFDGLNNYATSTPWMQGYGRYPGETSGVVTLTNANYPYNTDPFVPPFYYNSFPMPLGMWGGGVSFAMASVGMPMAAPGSPGAQPFPTRFEPPQIRKEFPENWIFDTIENSNNSFEITKKIPDTITSWVITGFSMNAESGLALTKELTKVRVFQPFFVSTNLPYSVKRGEVIAIPVILFNYMSKTLDAEVTMDNTDGEYEFTEATNTVEEQAIDEVKRVKRVTIPSNTGKTVSFMIRPKKVGETTLKITAVTPLAGDAIHKSLKVEPEGVTHFENNAVFVTLNDKAEHNEKLTMNVPADAVPDSEFVEFSVVGDLLGPTFKNLDQLVRMPYGCGEQNMVNFVPNILVMKYLETAKKEMPELMEKSKKYMEIGYQRELTYKHDDGSYSAFGKSDKAGSTWLTAYVVRSFHQAIKYTDIDPKVILEGLDFLASKQVENGSFPEYGKLFDSAHQNELGLTAFVLLAFFENVEHIPKYSANIDKGIEYLVQNVDQSEDQYSLSIALLALQLAKHPKAEKLLAKLQSLAKQENNLKWWTQNSSNNDVEISSYVLLAILNGEPAAQALPIVKWLISKRNSNGGFQSTQDTVVGLQALTKFAEQAGAGSGEVDVEFVSKGSDKESSGKINVNKDNSLLLQTHVLPKSTRQVEFTAKGKGACMVQLSYRYNLADKEKKPSFDLNVSVKNSTTPMILNLEVCADYKPLDESSGTESNMAVLEVSLPSGFTADAESFEGIEKVDRVKRTETKNSDSTVVVYFDGITSGDVKCIPINAAKTHAVAKQKPAPVMIYDYYDTDRRSTEYYEIVSSLCDICEGDDCGSGCK